jgi:hypothetical protein
MSSAFQCASTTRWPSPAISPASRPTRSTSTEAGRTSPVATSTPARAARVAVRVTPATNTTPSRHVEIRAEDSVSGTTDNVSATVRDAPERASKPPPVAGHHNVVVRPQAAHR